SLLHMAAHVPEEPERCSNAQAQLCRARFIRRLCPLKGTPEIAAFLLEDLDPCCLCWTVKFTLRPLTQVGKHGRMPPFDRRQLSRFIQAPACVLVDGLEKTEPQAPVCLLAACHQVLVHKRAQHAQCGRTVCE